MAARLIAGRSYANWVHEFCQKKKYTLETVTPPLEQEDTARPVFQCVMIITDTASGEKLFEVKFVDESKQKAKQGAAFEMVRKMGYSDEQLEEEALKPKSNGDLPRSVRKANEARDAGLEVEQGPSVPYVDELMEDPKFDYVSELKRVCARAGLEKPSYTEVDATGPAHLRAFKMEAMVLGRGAVEDFKAKAHATGKKQQVKNLAASRLHKQIAHREEEIRQCVLQWAEQSEENKAQLPEEFFMDITEAAGAAAATGVKNLNLNA